MKPTLRQIAQKVGLHPVTVSRILSDTYAGSPETASRVRKLAQKLGYQTSIFAKAMRGSTMPLVLVSGGHDVYTAAYTREFERAFHAKGLSTVLASVVEDLPKLIDRFRPIATILMWPNLIPQISELTTREDVIAIHSQLPKGQSAKCHSLRIDFRAGFNAMGQYLLECGHRNFAFLTQKSLDDFPIFRERREGFLDAVGRESGVSVREILMQDVYKLPDVLNECFSASRRPTALVCEGDMLAWQSIFHLGQIRLRVPQDVSVTGCDGIPLMGACPSLTTVQVDHAGIAKAVTSWIIDDIAPAKTKGKKTTIHNYVHQCYIRKDSTVAPPSC